MELIERVAEAKDATPAQISLAWLLAQQPWIIPIPGTTRISRLEENLAAIDIALSGDELANIELALATVKIEGERYPAAFQARIDR